MALIKCPECGREVSDSAKACPGCGYAISKPSEKSGTGNEQNKTRMIIGIIIVVAVIIIIAIVSSNAKKKNDYYRRNSYSYSGGSDYSYGGSSSTSKNDDSTIFRNLDINDFSCSSGKYSGTMQCKVTNNYSYTVNGYFRVNFYDSNGSLIYNQLMSLPDVAPGESVVCSTSIPKDDYPYDYATVDFSQESLTTRD